MTESIDLTQDDNDVGISSSQQYTSRPLDNHQLELRKMKEQKKAMIRSKNTHQPTVIKSEDMSDYQMLEYTDLDSENNYLAAPEGGRYRSNEMSRQMPLNFDPVPRLSGRRDNPRRRDSRMDNQYTPFNADFQAPGRESTADMDSNSLFVDQSQDVLMMGDRPSRKRRRNWYDTFEGQEDIQPSIESGQHYEIPSTPDGQRRKRASIENNHQQRMPSSITAKQQTQLDKYNSNLNQQQNIPPAAPMTPTPTSLPRSRPMVASPHTPANGLLGVQARSQRRGHGAQTFNPNGNSFITQEDLQRTMTDLMEATNQFRTATNQVLDMAEDIKKLKDETRKQLAEMDDHMNKSFKDAAEQTSELLQNHAHSIEELQGGFLILEEKYPDLVPPTRGGAYGGSKAMQQPKSSGLFADLLKQTEPRDRQTQTQSRNPHTPARSSTRGSSPSQSRPSPNSQDSGSRPAFRLPSLGPMTTSPSQAPPPHLPAPFGDSVQNGIPPSPFVSSDMPGQVPAGGGGGGSS